MEKPKLEKVIEELKEVDAREWEIINNPHTYPKPYFELKRHGLIFCIGKDPEKSSFGYILHIENHDKNVHMTYEKEWGGQKKEMRDFYNELSKKIELYQQRDATERLGFVLYEEDIGKTNLEKIINRLKELDIRAWKSDKFFDKKCPVLTAEVSGIIFSISKGLISGYGLEIKHDKESDKKFRIDYKKTDKKYVRKLIGGLYEKVYKELKEDEEKEFGESLNHFLSD
ncbi:MAG: hypothetical protein Q8O03_00725 [Nanoarchaeota archaeon]|nr:hypothetical protein [Nanoarchaeota archaeon]